MDPEPLRFADILTTASAAADYLGSPTVGPEHILHAVAILREQKTLDDLGRPTSPFLRGALGPRGEVEPAVRALVQRWFERLGSSVNAELDGEPLAEFVAEVEALRPEGGAAESES